MTLNRNFKESSSIKFNNFAHPTQYPYNIVLYVWSIYKCVHLDFVIKYVYDFNCFYCFNTLEAIYYTFIVVDSRIPLRCSVPVYHGKHIHVIYFWCWMHCVTMYISFFFLLNSRLFTFLLLSIILLFFIVSRFDSIKREC